MYWYEMYKRITLTESYYTDGFELFPAYLKITQTKNSLRFYNYIKIDNKFKRITTKQIHPHKYMSLTHQEAVGRFPEEFI